MNINNELHAEAPQPWRPSTRSPSKLRRSVHGLIPSQRLCKGGVDGIVAYMKRNGYLLTLLLQATPCRGQWGQWLAVHQVALVADKRGGEARGLHVDPSNPSINIF